MEPHFPMKDSASTDSRFKSVIRLNTRSVAATKAGSSSTAAADFGARSGLHLGPRLLGLWYRLWYLDSK